MNWPNKGKTSRFQSCANRSCLPLCRSVFPQSQVAHKSITAASGSNSPQSDVLMRENERLRKELEVYVEKAARLQKVREEGDMSSWLAEGVEVVKTVVSLQYMSEWWAVSPLGLYKLERWHWHRYLPVFCFLWCVEHFSVSFQPLEALQHILPFLF